MDLQVASEIPIEALTFVAAARTDLADAITERAWSGDLSLFWWGPTEEGEASRPVESRRQPQRGEPAYIKIAEQELHDSCSLRSSSWSTSRVIATEYGVQRNGRPRHRAWVDQCIAKSEQRKEGQVFAMATWDISQWKQWKKLSGHLLPLIDIYRVF